LKLLEERNSFIDLTLMFQLEVAERLVAKPGTKAYGFLSVMTQQATRPRILFQIPPHAFRPRPKVYSAMVHLEPLGKDEPFVREPELFETIVKSLFAHRRKNISNNIKHLRSPLLDPDTMRSALEHLEIEPSRRAETLTVNEFVALAHFCTSRQ
jgi:16S rRNA (adenine1518-N6/adenine1519-N6)-dimethyltransferase